MKRPCLVCGKECQPWHRTVDGTYMHDACAKQVSAQPTILLRSRRAKEEGT